MGDGGDVDDRFVFVFAAWCSLGLMVCSLCVSRGCTCGMLVDVDKTKGVDLQKSGWQKVCVWYILFTLHSVLSPSCVSRVAVNNRSVCSTRRGRPLCDKWNSTTR